MPIRERKKPLFPGGLQESDRTPRKGLRPARSPSTNQVTLSSNPIPVKFPNAKPRFNSKIKLGDLGVGFLTDARRYQNGTPSPNGRPLSVPSRFHHVIKCRCMARGCRRRRTTEVSDGDEPPPTLQLTRAERLIPVRSTDWFGHVFIPSLSPIRNCLAIPRTYRFSRSVSDDGKGMRATEMTYNSLAPIP
jgi:hypothetical protein